MAAAEPESGPKLSTKPPILSLSDRPDLVKVDSPQPSPSLRQDRNGSRSPRSNRSSLILDLPSGSTAQTAMSALQYLPVPVIVLSSLKTVVLANDAMGKLLCMSGIQEVAGEDCGCGSTGGVQEIYGQTLSQVGVDMLHNEAPVWVNWESFLETVGEGSHRNPQASGEATPTLKLDSDTLATGNNSKLDRTTVSDVAVDVILSPERCIYSKKTRDGRKVGSIAGVVATMIISTWWANGAKYYTLSFVSSSPNPSATPVKPAARTMPKSYKSHDSPGSVSSVSSDRRSQAGSSPSSSISSPSPYVPNFPPFGPATKTGPSTSASILQKATRLREAILNTMNLPCYALWKDQTVGIPNDALMKLCTQETAPDSGSDFLNFFVVWDEHFTRKLDFEEFPIIELLRSQKSSVGRRIGLKDPKTGAPKVFDCNCECVMDSETDEFLGGIVILKDVTDYVDRLAVQKGMTQQQFEYISNNVPAMVWTTTPDGSPDWFSMRWYEYTGLTPEQSLGARWRGPFHPDDLPATNRRWANSLATGEEFITEYRCRRRDGEWRWFQGRARPMTDDTGKIVRWFGTSVDIHDAIEARETARFTRQQLLRVIETAKLTLCSVDLKGQITMLEGSKRWQNTDDKTDPHEYIGESIFDSPQDLMSKEELIEYQRPVWNILEGRSTHETCDFKAENGRRFRNEYRPLLRKRHDGGGEGDTVLDGADIVSVDITSIKKREEELQAQEKENAKLVANALAAKEASKLKSSFLANMSHEIRTPIAGVIGMAELLSDMSLNEEQAECAENILRSANGLLTVINDILDFSKVESGRLDIEEVQFNLSVVLHDVNKMLSFAAVRKNLTYDTTIAPQVANDLHVMGDPGRLRQILTNLLTNSIKFTSEGTVSLSAKVRKETSDAVDVEFTVNDTGIGIEEEIRKKLFTPFSQADSSTARRFGGTGLGLTISKNLVDLMHGSIWLESKLGVGTTCSFWVPFKKAEYVPNGSPLVDLGVIPDRLQSDLSVSMGSDERGISASSPIFQNNRRPNHFQTLAPPSMSVNAPSSNPSPKPRQDEESLSYDDRQNTHILVVEDNAVNQQIALKTIRKLNFSVNAVWNGQEAVDYVFGDHEVHRPKPDIILMDVQMPILDGYKATEKIRKRKQAPNLTVVPIVAMTASAIQGDKEKCVKAGMDDYLAKPVKGKILEKMLVKWTLESRKRRADPSSVPSHITMIGTGVASKFQDSNRPSRQGSGSNTDSFSSFSSQDGRDRFYKDSAIAKSTETEAASRQRRAEQEERAIFLRDDKLLSVAQDPRLNRHHSDQGEHYVSALRASHALTKENVESYNERSEQDGGPEDHAAEKDPMREMLGQKLKKKSTNSSSMVPRARSEDIVTKQRPLLPLKPDKHDSQRTITKS